MTLMVTSKAEKQLQVSQTCFLIHLVSSLCVIVVGFIKI